MAQKDKSEHDENRHMEETLRAVAEDEENKLSASADVLPAEETLQSDVVENEEANLPAGDELSMKESSISSLSNLSSNLNDLDLPDSGSEGTIQAQSGSNPETLVDTYMCMHDLKAAAEQSAPATAEVLEPQSKELDPPSEVPGTDTEELKQEYVSMTFTGVTAMEAEEDLPPPPVMDEVYVNEEVEFPPAPPAPPMSDVSEERKKNIANIREKFLKQEQEAILKAQEKPKLEKPKIKHHVQPFVVQSDNVPGESPHNGVHSPKRLPPGGVDSPHLGSDNRTYYHDDTISQSSVNGTNSAPVNRKRPAAPKRAESTRLSSLSQTSIGSNEYEKYDDVIGVAIPPPPPYPAPVPPSHYTNRQTMSLHRDIPPPPNMQPPPPPMSSSQYHADDIYEDEFAPPPFPHPDGIYDFIDTAPPPPPPNHPSTLRSVHPHSTGPTPPPAPPAPPAPPTSSLAKQLGGVRLNKSQGNQRVSAPPKMENQMDQMLQEIKKRQMKRRDSEQSSTCYEVDDTSMQQVTKSPPPTSPKPVGKFNAGPPPPATKPKPNTGSSFKGPVQSKSVSKPPVETEGGGGTPPTIDESIPAWRRNMIEKKRKEEEARQREEEMMRKAEEEKWKGIPEWKRKIMEAKEQKKAEEQAQKMEADKERLELEAKLAEMPEWKRKVFMKKHGLDKNGDENANNDSPSTVS